MADNFKLLRNISLNNNGRLGEQKPISEMSAFVRLYEDEKHRLTAANKYSFDFTSQSKYRRDESFAIGDFIKQVE
jgi:hypothetical protein